MRERYRLCKPHSINRILHPVGYEIELPTQLGDWLCEQGVAERVERVIPSIALFNRAMPALLVRPVVTKPVMRRSCCGWR